MCERPIEFSSLGVDRTEGQSAVANASHRDHLGIVSRRKDFICLLEILVRQSLLDYIYSALTQQTDHPLARYPSEKRAIRNGRKHYTIFRHENIRGGEFGDVAEHIADDCIIEAAGVRLKQRLFGYRHPALASTGIVSSVGRR